MAACHAAVSTWPTDRAYPASAEFFLRRVSTCWEHCPFPNWQIFNCRRLAREVISLPQFKIQNLNSPQALPYLHAWLAHIRGWAQYECGVVWFAPNCMRRRLLRWTGKNEVPRNKLTLNGTSKSVTCATRSIRSGTRSVLFAAGGGCSAVIESR